MFPHWQYVLEDLLGPITSVYARNVTHLTQRWDESRQPYAVTADDAAYAVLEFGNGAFASVNSSWAVRVNRRELLEIQVDGTHGSAVAGLRNCAAQHRVNTPMPVWNPDLPDPIDHQALWLDVPDTEDYGNGFKVQWELFLAAAAAGAPFRWDLAAAPAACCWPDWRSNRRMKGGGWTFPPRRKAFPRRARADGRRSTDPASRPRRRPHCHQPGLGAQLSAAHVAPGVRRRPRRGAVRRSDRLGRHDELSRAPLAHGFGIAEAMDTAQRGMGLSWAVASELITRSAERLAKHRAAGTLTGMTSALACGAGTDQLADGESHSLAAIARAYQEQLHFVQDAGADVILMASRALAASARSARDYLDVYGELLSQAERPVILHWLGDAFDPALRGYWGGSDFGAASDTVLELIERAGRGGRDQALRARRGQGSGAAPTAAGRHPAVHRRRLQLPGTDPGRCRRAQRRAARDIRGHRRPGGGGAARTRPG